MQLYINCFRLSYDVVLFAAIRLSAYLRQTVFYYAFPRSVLRSVALRLSFGRSANEVASGASGDSCGSCCGDLRGDGRSCPWRQPRKLVAKPFTADDPDR